MQAIKVMMAILLFLFTYVMLLAVAVGLAVACCYAGIWLIILKPMFLTIILGLGLIGVGVSVCYFLVKFMFAVSKDENAYRIPVTEAEQPELFAFIRRLTAETNTRFPKKIFLSPDVNACVFYHSSFWSMFLPIRKNLEIGLGLVNSINISEFKAVMAHEFGHFSQRSMKLGSFTYNTNRIIYNMLYDNKGYTAFLQSWGGLHSGLAFFANITIRIAQGIQWILRGMYRIINKSYLALSREMEFHADTIAASVAGGNNLVTALSRVEVANGCYSSAINAANEWLREKKVARNIFSNQLIVFRAIASRHRLPLKQGLPEVNHQFIRSFSKSRINYKNQWASHPTLDERRQHLEQVAMDAPADDTSAWALFHNAAGLQESVTAHLYHDVPMEGNMQQCGDEEFETWHAEQEQTYSLPAAYKGFYDSRFIGIADWDLSGDEYPPQPGDFDELFNEENGQIQASINNNENDLALVAAIKENRLDVTSFDFDGIKYTRSDCDSIIARLEKENEDLKARQAALDKQAFRFFCTHANGQKQAVLAQYRQFQAFCKRNGHYVEIAHKINTILQPFYEGGLTVDEVNTAVTELRNTHEWELKRALQAFMDERVITPESHGDLHARITAFIAARYTYFKDNVFQNDELSELYDLAIKVAGEIGDLRFRCYKQLLETQLAACGCAQTADA